MEKAGAWKPAKTKKSRFPPAPTLPWKSRRRREIPTFPPRRRVRLWTRRKRPKQRQRPNRNPNRNPRRRPKGRVALFHKADRSRINRTGQLDLLATVAYVPLRSVDTNGYRAAGAIGDVDGAHGEPGSARAC